MFLMRLPMPFSRQDPISTSSPQKRDRPLPRGLWKARVTPRFLAKKGQSPPPKSNFGSDTDHDDDDYASSSSSTSKKQRSSSSLSDISSRDEQIYYWDYSRRCSPYPDRVSSWETRTKVMDTSTTAGSSSEPKADCDYEDWEDLKDLFAKAAEQYESALSHITMITS